MPFNWTILKRGSRFRLASLSSARMTSCTVAVLPVPGMPEMYTTGAPPCPPPTAAANEEEEEAAADDEEEDEDEDEDERGRLALGAVSRACRSSV